MKNILVGAVLFLLLPLPAGAEDFSDKGSPADVLQVRNVEITFHQAGSVLPNKDLDLMMSLFEKDAVLIDTSHDNKVYAGANEIRRYFRDVAPPFRPENHWIGYTPAMRMRSQIEGDKAALYFECLWMDVDKNAIGAHSFSDMTLARSGGGWLVQTIKVGRVEKL